MGPDRWVAMTRYNNGLIASTSFHVPCHMTHEGVGLLGAGWKPQNVTRHRRIRCSSLFKEKKKKE